MRTATIFILLLMLFGCNEYRTKQSSSDNTSISTSSDCVKSIYEKDSIFGDLRNHASETVSVSEAIDAYTKNLKSLDFSGCPKEFELAFDEHIDAWLEFRQVSDKYPLLRGELHQIFEEIEQSKDSVEFKSRLKKIFDTWKTVQASSAM